MSQLENRQPLAKKAKAFEETQNQLRNLWFELGFSPVDYTFEEAFSRLEKVSFGVVTIDKKKETVVRHDNRDKKVIAKPTKEKSSADKFDPYIGFCVVQFKSIIGMTNTRFERKYAELLDCAYEDLAVEFVESLGMTKEFFLESTKDLGDRYTISFACGPKSKKAWVEPPTKKETSQKDPIFFSPEEIDFITHLLYQAGLGD